jgi:hypothetical protein
MVGRPPRSDWVCIYPVVTTFMVATSWAVRSWAGDAAAVGVLHVVVLG